MKAKGGSATINILCTCGVVINGYVHIEDNEYNSSTFRCACGRVWSVCNHVPGELKGVKVPAPYQPEDE